MKRPINRLALSSLFIALLAASWIVGSDAPSSAAPAAAAPAPSMDGVRAPAPVHSAHEPQLDAAPRRPAAELAQVFVLLAGERCPEYKAGRAGRGGSPHTR